ncbi:MAG: hypothetical protein IPF66_09310 [Holophagales bacterium]|nr:hypothetical protein [Holophagales bacterium]
MRSLRPSTATTSSISSRSERSGRASTPAGVRRAVSWRRRSSRSRSVSLLRGRASPTRKARTRAERTRVRSGPDDDSGDRVSGGHDDDLDVVPQARSGGSDPVARRERATGRGSDRGIRPDPADLGAGRPRQPHDHPGPVRVDGPGPVRQRFRPRPRSGREVVHGGRRLRLDRRRRLVHRERPARLADDRRLGRPALRNTSDPATGGYAFPGGVVPVKIPGENSTGKLRWKAAEPTECEVGSGLFGRYYGGGAGDPLWRIDGVNGIDPPDPAPIAARVDPVIDFPNWTGNLPAGVGAAGPTYFSVRWEGWLVPPDTDNYILNIKTDDGVRLWLDGVLVAGDVNWTSGHGARIFGRPAASNAMQSLPDRRSSTGRTAARPTPSFPRRRRPLWVSPPSFRPRSSSPTIAP